MLYAYLEDYVKQVDSRRRREAAAERQYALARAPRENARPVREDATCGQPAPTCLRDTAKTAR